MSLFQESRMSFKIGILDPGVMGHDPALDMERNGFPAAGRDLDGTCTQAFLEAPAVYSGLRDSWPSPKAREILDGIELCSQNFSC
jgi:hypothetical protein